MLFALALAEWERKSKEADGKEMHHGSWSLARVAVVSGRLLVYCVPPRPEHLCALAPAHRDKLKKTRAKMREKRKQSRGETIKALKL